MSSQYIMGSGVTYLKQWLWYFGYAFMLSIDRDIKMKFLINVIKWNKLFILSNFKFTKNVQPGYKKNQSVATKA